MAAVVPREHVPVEVHARGRLRVPRQHHAAELDSSTAGRRAYRLMNVRARVERIHQRRLAIA